MVAFERGMRSRTSFIVMSLGGNGHSLFNRAPILASLAAGAIAPTTHDDRCISVIE